MVRLFRIFVTRMKAGAAGRAAANSLIAQSRQDAYYTAFRQAYRSHFAADKDQEVHWEKVAKAVYFLNGVDHASDVLEKIIAEEENLLGYFERPLGYLKIIHGEKFFWPTIEKSDERIMPNIFARFNGKNIAYVEDWAINRALSTAVIEHIATEKGCERRGIGRVLANSLFAEMHARYGITKLVFREYSTRYQKMYPPFFLSLGAVLVERRQRDEWHWDFSSIARDERLGRADV